MKKILSYLIFLLYISVGDAIVGGTRASISNYPFLASIHVHNDDPICSGTIISSSFVLGAASCLFLDINVSLANVVVITGLDNRESRTANSIVTRHDVFWIIVHPNYSVRNFWANDIAMLKVTPVIIWNRNSFPVGLPKVLDPRKTLWISGWGTYPVINSVALSSPNNLRRMPIKRLQHNSCCKKFERVLNENQHCGVTTTINSHITLGDSGSPMTISKRIYGIVSVVARHRNLPFLYTRVFKYVDWIEETKKNY